MSISSTFRIFALTLFVSSCFATSADQITYAEDAVKKSTKDKKEDEFPTIDVVTKDYEEIKSEDGKKTFFKLWKNDDTGRVLARLPKNYASSSARQFIAPTVSGGELFAGLQSDDFYVYWRRYGKRLALMQENLSIKGSDEESKSSVDRLFTDKVLLDVPILTMDANSPVIDLTTLLVENARVFFGRDISPQRELVSISEAKAYPKNVEIAYEVPMRSGNLKTIHYSISEIKGSEGFKPRVADQRIGYFLTSYLDYGKYESDETSIRYINRWHLEKRDDKLKISPPKKPIVFYIEHTTPVRYRRWVREGILSWNKAFEQIGISSAIEVRQQDKQTGEHMNISPEDVRYNFVRWLNNDVSTAIGPSRVNPKTGEILDADIVLTDGWIRSFQDQFSDMMPKIVMEGKSPETLAWYAKHPNWDPRLRLAEPSQRNFLRQQFAHQSAQPYGDHPSRVQKTKLMGDEASDGLVNRTSQINGGCMAAEGRGFDVALMRMSMAVMRSKRKQKEKAEAEKAKDEDDEDSEEDEDSDDDEDSEEDEGDDEDEDDDEEDEDESEKDEDEDDEDDEDEDDEDEDEESEQILDGMPESFIGPLLSDLVSHEVGHTLGLRHNFKASSVYDVKDVNSEAMKGKKPLAGSVMDYLPTNFKMNNGEIQGDYAMIGVGPYDMWAIEYGYTLNKKKLPKILKRVSEPQLAYATDEDTWGPDPLARRYDFGKEPLVYAQDQVAMSKMHRETILDKFVEDGESWGKARKGYLMSLGLQTRATSMMSNWLGGTFVNRDLKGDPNDRKPIVVVPAEQQRKALEFVLENVFFDEAYGLTPELLAYMTNEPLEDRSGPSWPIHDRVMGIQASMLSSLLDPWTLRQIYDNEFRVPSDEDAFTLNELFTKVNASIWEEIEEAPKGKFTERKPAISSLRRNLQTEHIERLFDLAGESESMIAAMKPIANLASMTLRDMMVKLETAKEDESYDAYTQAHLEDSFHRVKKWVDSTYVINNDDSSGGFGGFFFFGKEGE